MNPVPPGSLSSATERIRELERNVALTDFAMGAVVLVIGYLVWKRLLWGVPLGMVLGFASFHLLVAQASRLGSTSGWAVGAVVAFSSLKLAGLFLIVLGLYAIQLVDLVQVLVGLLLSQFGVAVGIGWEMRRLPIVPIASGS